MREAGGRAKGPEGLIDLQQQRVSVAIGAVPRHRGRLRAIFLSKDYNAPGDSVAVSRLAEPQRVPFFGLGLASAFILGNLFGGERCIKGGLLKACL